MEAQPKADLIELFNCLLNYAYAETEKVENRQDAYIEYCGFRIELDWFKYRASVDLLQDTDSAILDVFEYQLGAKQHRNDLSESYLRLYGVLNAVYLQIGAYTSLANLLNYPGSNSLVLPLKEMKIYLYRHIAGAHTYKMDPNEDHIHMKQADKEKVKSFRLVQSSLNKDGNRIELISQNSENYRFDLLFELWEYELKSREVLEKLIRHMIQSRIRKKIHKEKITKDLEEKLLELCDYRRFNKNTEYEKERPRSA